MQGLVAVEQANLQTLRCRAASLSSASLQNTSAGVMIARACVDCKSRVADRRQRPHLKSQSLFCCSFLRGERGSREGRGHPAGEPLIGSTVMARSDMSPAMRPCLQSQAASAASSISGSACRRLPPAPLACCVAVESSVDHDCRQPEPAALPARAYAGPACSRAAGRGLPALRGRPCERYRAPGRPGASELYIEASLIPTCGGRHLG